MQAVPQGGHNHPGVCWAREGSTEPSRLTPSALALSRVLQVRSTGVHSDLVSNSPWRPGWPLFQSESVTLLNGSRSLWGRSGGIFLCILMLALWDISLKGPSLPFSQVAPGFSTGSDFNRVRGHDFPPSNCHLPSGHQFLISSWLFKSNHSSQLPMYSTKRMPWSHKHCHWVCGGR